MENIAIRVENLSKQYRLGSIGTGTLAHDINKWWHTVRGKENPYLKIGETNDRTKKGGSDYVWSLRDINFQINQGDAVGIIGKNGAGKSTLLKLLSRVTSPTTGIIKARGRIASLLEVGTGFHPDLTGRENVFLNGAILGMNKREIRRKFDEIVDFAGVGKYIDTPVKRYSSGMYVRLAFAVAAYLESEILIVDEVLAVGDSEFQKKCLGKMRDVRTSEGRTVLFVSHNMASIRNLCTKGIILRNGNLVMDGGIEDVINEYLNERNEFSKMTLAEITEREGNGLLRFQSIRFLDRTGAEKTSFCIGEYLEIQINFQVSEAFKDQKNSTIDLGINDFMDNRVAWISSNIYTDKIDPTSGKIKFVIEKLMINQGSYNINLYCGTEIGIADWIKNASRLNVYYDDYYGTGRAIPENQGYITTDFKLG